MSGEESGLSRQFFSDAVDLLSEAEELVLHLENHGYDEDSIHSLFRYFHTLKGNSNMVGETEINKLTHTLESHLDEVRKGKSPLSDELIQATFEAIDLLSVICQEESSEGYTGQLRQMTADLATDGEESAGREKTSAEEQEPVGASGREAASEPSGAAGHSAAPQGESSKSVNAPQVSIEGDFEQWRPLMHAFYRVKELADSLRGENGDPEELLLELGMEGIELRSSAVEYDAPVERLCTYIEKFLATLTREQILYNEISYELLFLLLEDLEGVIMRRLREKGAIRETVIGSLQELRELPGHLRDSAALNVVEISLPEQQLFKDKNGLELFSAVNQAAPGRVIFVNPGSGVYQKATALLDETLGGFLRVTESAEEGLYQLMRAEEKQ